MKCKICSCETASIFKGEMLRKYKGVNFFYCSNCEFLFTEDPNWLQEAYSEPISSLDTGAAQRSVYLKNKVAVLLYYLFGKKVYCLDYGGGNGLFVRLMRDIGFHFYRLDPYASNEFARGFEFSSKQDIDLVTSFECFEHFVDPIKSVEEILGMGRSILFTTNFLPDPIPKPNEWWYYSLETGQHISFYRKKTFDYIAKKYQLYFYTDGGLHLLTNKKISLRLYCYLLRYSKYFYWFVKRNMSSLTMNDRAYIKDSFEGR